VLSSSKSRLKSPHIDQARLQQLLVFNGWSFYITTKLWRSSINRATQPLPRYLIRRRLQSRLHRRGRRQKRIVDLSIPRHNQSALWPRLKSGLTNNWAQWVDTASEGSWNNRKVDAKDAQGLIQPFATKNVVKRHQKKCGAGLCLLFLQQNLSDLTATRWPYVARSPRAIGGLLIKAQDASQTWRGKGLSSTGKSSFHRAISQPRSKTKPV
jgi:hypothetical protein